MSAIRVSEITNRDGNGGPVIVGLTTVGIITSNVSLGSTDIFVERIVFGQTGIMTGAVSVGTTDLYVEQVTFGQTGIMTGAVSVGTTDLYVSGTLESTGDIVFSGGVGIADSLYHIGDSDTAIKFPAADTFTVETSGSERLRVDSAGRLLVGTLSSDAQRTSKFQLAGNGDLSGWGSSLNLSEFGTTYNPWFALQRSRNSTIGSHTVVNSGDILGGIQFNGSDGNSFESGAYIKCEVDGTPGDGDMPGRLIFSTTPSGSATPSERLHIRSTGAWGLGGSNYGTSGQALTSNGSGSAPTWTTVSPPDASTTVKGIVQLSTATNSTSTTLASTPSAVKAAYDLAASKTSNTGTVTSVATSGAITGGTITTSGTISARSATTSQTGVVQLSTSISSTSTTLAATASAAKSAYDRGTTGVNNAATAQSTANSAQSTANTANTNANTALSRTANGSIQAWVNFNGTGTVSIRASANVSSITDFGVGDYRMNFSSSISSSYAWFGACSQYNQINIIDVPSGQESSYPTTTSLRFNTPGVSQSGPRIAGDCVIVNVVILR